MDEKRQNREIKFRMWRDGKMHKLREMHTDESDNFCFQKAEQDGFIMQYTGLKDKTGKEIYEGDVIEYTKETFPEDSDVLVYVTKRDRIVFSGGHFQASKSSFGWEGEDLIYLPTSTVIGNIYQNPELSES